MTKADADIAMKFLDPTGSGRFSSKCFVELVSHPNLQNLKDFNVNICMVLSAIYEAYDS